MIPVLAAVVKNQVCATAASTALQRRAIHHQGASATQIAFLDTSIPLEMKNATYVMHIAKLASLRTILSAQDAQRDSILTEVTATIYVQMDLYLMIRQESVKSVLRLTVHLAPDLSSSTRIFALTNALLQQERTTTINALIAGMRIVLCLSSRIKLLSGLRMEV